MKRLEVQFMILILCVHQKLLEEIVLVPQISMLLSEMLAQFRKRHDRRDS